MGWMTALVLVGFAATLACGPRHAAQPPATPLQSLASKSAADADWPAYYAPQLVRDVTATDATTGEPAQLERGYVLHRLDVEKIRVLDARAQRCAIDLRACEVRITNLATMPSLLSRWEGRILLVGLGFLVGAATTVGIVHTVK